MWVQGSGSYLSRWRMYQSMADRRGQCDQQGEQVKQNEPPFQELSLVYT